MAGRENVFEYPNERIIVLSDRIDHSSVGQAIGDIVSWNRQDEDNDGSDPDFVKKPIKLYVQTFGGSVYDAWGLIDVISTSRTPIYTYCLGHAMSAGFLIFLAGKKRFISKHATLLYHQISVWGGGTIQDVVEGHEEKEWLQKKMERFVLDHSRFKKKQLRKIRKNKVDFYIHAKDCLRLGLADEIIKEADSRKSSKGKRKKHKKKQEYIPKA